MRTVSLCIHHVMTSVRRLQINEIEGLVRNIMSGTDSLYIILDHFLSARSRGYHSSTVLRDVLQPSSSRNCYKLRVSSMSVSSGPPPNYITVPKKGILSFCTRILWTAVLEDAQRNPLTNSFQRIPLRALDSTTKHLKHANLTVDSI